MCPRASCKSPTAAGREWDPSVPSACLGHGHSTRGAVGTGPGSPSGQLRGAPAPARSGSHLGQSHQIKENFLVQDDY